MHCTCENLRVDVDGTPDVDGLTFSSQGSSVAIVGASPALFDAIAGVRPIVAGRLEVNGLAVPDAVRKGLFLAADATGRMPPGWTLIDFLTWSARLTGLSKAAAARATGAVLQTLRLSSLASHPLGRLPPLARRIVPIAAALSSDASVIAFRNPLEGLLPNDARMLGRTLLEGLAGRSFVCFSEVLALTSPLDMEVEDTVVLMGSRVLAQGPSAELLLRDRLVSLRVAGDADALMQALAERGLPVDRGGHGLIVDLGVASTRELFATAVLTRTHITELRFLAARFK